MVRKSMFVIIVLFFGAIFAGEALAQQVVTGTTGEGSRFEFWVPDNWNKDLVLWVHGIVDPALPVDLFPDATQGMGGLRDGLLNRGYAFAYSTFSENGYAVKDGVQRTHQLRGLFISKFGKPEHTFLYGISMGGAITIALLEKFPKQYDGAVCQCGVVGGYLPEAQYVSNGRILYDVFYSSGAFGAFPYQLPGDADHPVTLPFGSDSPAYKGVLSNFLRDGALLYDFNVTAQIPFDFANPLEAYNSAMTMIALNVVYSEDMLSHTHNRLPFDNMQTSYHNPLHPSQDGLINLNADRFPSSPDAVHYLDSYYSPTGMINAPVYTIHTTRDPVVPVWHESLLAGKVAAAGRSQFLSQKTYDRWGHCAFSLAERLAAFDALISWIATGDKPTP